MEPKEVKPRAEPRRRARQAGQGRVERGDRWAAYLNLEPSTWPLSCVSRSLIQVWVGGCRERVPVHSSQVMLRLDESKVRRYRAGRITSARSLA